MKNVINCMMIISMTLISCDREGVDISKMNENVVSFNELPKQVRVFIINPSLYYGDGFKKNSLGSLIMECINCEDEYVLETIKTAVGPWNSYYLITNLSSHSKFNIAQGTPTPFLIFNDYLYVPDQFNLFSKGEKLNTVKFKQYSLKTN